MSGRSRHSGFSTWMLVAALAVGASMTGCGGLRFRGFFTPSYRIPSGYSETYREHLERQEQRSRKREWSDPSLGEIRSTPTPLLLTPKPGRTDSAESNGSANRKNPPFSGSGDGDGASSR